MMNEKIIEILMKHLHKRWFINDVKDVCFMTEQEIEDAIDDAITEIQNMIIKG